MKKIVHLTSVHHRYDNRILLKMCSSLAKENYDVTLMVADGLGAEEYRSVHIVDIGKARSRVLRFIQTIPRLARMAFREKADLYHFHDPELIPLGLLLRLARRRVVYDIHEDYVTSIRQKTYLSNWLAYAIAFVFNGFEKWTARCFHQVIAEKYYQERFPHATAILNYPLLDAVDEQTLPDRTWPSGPTIDVIYTGNITSDRGAMEHARMVAEIPQVRLTAVGKCSSVLAREMMTIVDDESRLRIVGIDEFVKPEDINKFYVSQAWTAGLALFPKTEHYAQKELTKFFEYMKFGIPIVCANFPVWEKFVKENNCGFAVDPYDYREIDQVLKTLQEDRALRASMGHHGRKQYLEKYNWSIEEQKLVRLYRQILKE